MKSQEWRQGFGLALALVLILTLSPGPVLGQAGHGGHSGPVQVGPEYIIAPYDSLEYRVMGHDDLSKGHLSVAPDGTITVPLLGQVLVAGKTLAQVREILEKGFKKYVKRPVVSVWLSHASPPKALVYVVGSVVRPGQFDYQAGWTVLEAIAAAGGVLPRAALKRATIFRRENGHQVTMPVNLETLLIQKDEHANVDLQAGDTLLVPLLQMRVLVLGNVRIPGPFDIEESTRLLDAVAMAGGPADRAAMDQVGVVRQGADGKLKVTTSDLNKVVRQGDMSQNPVLQHADIVFVPQSTSLDWRVILASLLGVFRLFGLP